jgi:Asp-tRNA(Asn)/Glu-tRNA(Gln) amidotransferase A subunit family amidase
MDHSPSRLSPDPAQLSATAAAALIRTKQLSCEELARACLARISARDGVVKAWLSLDPHRARELDKLPPTGPLHGLPFGVKDIIDTADYPTTQNSPIYDQLKVGRDAACVAVVRGSGALILGKTDTVEFASSGRKALSANPFNAAHTPGGSSSGSGIEPAGVTALEGAAAKLTAAGAIVEELVLPEPSERLHAAHAAIMAAEGAASFLPEYVTAYDKLAPLLRDRVENVGGPTPQQWLEAYALAESCRVQFDALFGVGLNVVLTPSSPGEAPLGLHTTGDTIFNSMWTLLHGPNIGIPAGRGPKNLPVGVTLVGPRMSDSRLLSIAKALAPVIDTDEPARLHELWG